MIKKLRELQQDVYKVLAELEKIPKEERVKIGEKALGCCGDYPLYGATSNITYEEAIIIVMLTNPLEFDNIIKEVYYAKLGSK